MNADNYQATALTDTITINKIVTIHYFEFARNFVFEGESHDFWEFVYVDKGEVEVMAEKKGYILKQGEIIFHKPNEFHNIWANGKTAPNVVVVSFKCNSPAMNYFKNKMFKIAENEREILAQIIKEGYNAFKGPFNDMQMKKMTKNESSLVGSEQLIKTYLELLLLMLIRKDYTVEKSDRLSPIAKERTDNNMINNVINFLIGATTKKLTLDDIAKKFHVSKTYLKTTFKQNTGISIMKYFMNLKIEDAKRMIREEDCTFSEISDKLDFSSVHHFSRTFKNCTGMTPSEYIQSVQSKARN